MSHQCPVMIPGKGQCPGRVSDDLLMDTRHWQIVPVALQRAVYRAYGRHGEGTGTTELRAAQRAAIRAVDRKLTADASRPTPHRRPT